MIWTKTPSWGIRHSRKVHQTIKNRSSLVKWKARDKTSMNYLPSKAIPSSVDGCIIELCLTVIWQVGLMTQYPRQGINFHARSAWSRWHSWSVAGWFEQQWWIKDSKKEAKRKKKEKRKKEEEKDIVNSERICDFSISWWQHHQRPRDGSIIFKSLDRPKCFHWNGMKNIYYT